MIFTKITLSDSDVISLGKKMNPKNYRLDLYAIHKFVYTLFPGNERNFVYSKIKNQIFIYSKDYPVIDGFEKYNIDIKKIPNNFLKNKEYLFRININSAKRDSKTQKYFCVRYNDFENWFKEKMLRDNINIKSIDMLKQYNIKEKIKNGNEATINGSICCGRLEVSDNVNFEDLLIRGFGREKAFGFGMMLVKPIK